MRGYQAIGALLHHYGTSTVFSMIGGTNVPWLAHGVESGTLRLVKTRHETAAVVGAMGYAQSTGAVGACTVVRGPGFANTINALVTATRNHVPLVMVVAESPTADPHKAQNIDQRGFTELIGAGFHHVEDAAHLPAAMVAALRDARWNGCPQVLSIADPPVLDGEVDLGDLPDLAAAPVDEPDPGEVAAAVDALERAERPLLLAGQGAVLAGCRAGLDELADLVGARVATSLMAARFFSGHPRDLGVSGGWASGLTRRHLREADLVLAVGASLNGYTLGGDGGSVYGDSVLVHCDVDAAAVGSRTPVDLRVVGDAGATVRALVAEWRRRGHPSRPPSGEPAGIDDVRASVLGIDLGGDPARGLDPRAVYRVLDRLLPPDRIVVSDGGRTLPTLPSLVDARDARSFLVTNGFASIGLGLGTAIGAAAAHPDRAVVLFCGDGGFMMSAQELDAVRIAGLDLMVVVMNDRQYGAEIRHLARFGLPEDVIRQDPPDLVAMAELFGGTGTVVADERALEQLVLPGSGLHILDVRIDPRVDGRGAVGAKAEAALAAV